MHSQVHEYYTLSRYSMARSLQSRCVAAQTWALESRKEAVAPSGDDATRVSNVEDTSARIQSS